MRSAASGDGKPDGGLWGSIGEWVHGTLDVAGFVPGLGEIADGVNALIYLAEGRYVEAAISAAAMIPIVGDAGKAGKWGVKAGKEILEEAAETGAERVAKEAAEGVSERQLRAGAGGNWPVINEIRDLRVVQQTDNLSCGAACGEMVLKDRGVQIPQNVIAQQGGGVPMSAGSLKDALNALDKSNVEQWRGGFIDIPGASDQQIFATLSQTGSWVAILYEGPGAKLAHAVVVDGMDAAGRAMIRDPWNGTSYLMNSDDFLNVWTSQAVFRSK
jgi:filamentous hemagglutinin